MFRICLQGKGFGLTAGALPLGQGRGLRPGLRLPPGLKEEIWIQVEIEGILSCGPFLFVSTS